MIKEISIDGQDQGMVWAFMKEIVGKVNDRDWEGRRAREWLCCGATVMDGRTVLALEFVGVLEGFGRTYGTFSVESLPLEIR